jgi:hypothetical protein
MAAVAARLARRIVRVLIGMQEGLQSGADSGLVSVWEEICVQVQGEHSVLWDAYDQTVHDLACRDVEALPQPVVRALWEWLDSTGELPGDAGPYSTDDVAEYLVRAVYGTADEWSNRRIRAYLGRG